ncbi:hypothetical protein Tco_0237812 [Tanacetum coccineum]
MASAAAKPCQGDSSESYLITGTPRALTFSTPPSSPLEPHPYLSSLNEPPPRSSNPLPQTLSQGLTQTLPQPAFMDFEPSVPPINLSISRLSAQPEPFLSREQVLDQLSQYQEFDLIMEYLVKISKKARILKLKQRHLKITVMTSNTPYPSRKIQHNRACTSLKTKRNDDQYAVSREVYTPYSTNANKIFCKISNVVPTLRNPRYAILTSFNTPMDNPNVTMEEYNRLEEEKARQRGKVSNWETAKYGKIWYDEDVHDLRSVITEFPAIVFNDELSSEKTLSCEPTVSSLNNNEIDFRISFDESNNEDYMVILDKNSFSYKIISVNDLKTDSENENEKVNMPSFLSPEPTVSYFDDLDFLKDFENEFLAIVYNDALTSKSDSSTEHVEIHHHIDEFDLKTETSSSECNEEELNIFYFNDLFPFNIIYTDDLKSDKDNDDNEIDITQSSGGNVNTQGSKKFLEASHDKINKIFIMKSFFMELDVNIVAWNYLVNGMLINLIKNLYVPFGIPLTLNSIIRMVFTQENCGGQDYDVLVKQEECWWKVNAHENATFARWENHGQGPYANAKTKKDYDPYLDINHIFGRDYGSNNAGNIQDNMKEYHNPSICKIRRFKMTKYSFDADDEYVAIKEREHSDHSRTDVDACQAYQEFFCIMDKVSQYGVFQFMDMAYWSLIQFV